MRKTGKTSLLHFSLGAILLLGGCSAQGPDARPAFGYSGLADGKAGISSYVQARADFMAGRFGLAVKRFEVAMAEDPTSVEATNGLAASYDRIGRFDLAQRLYRRALTMDPHSSQTLNNLGYSLLLQGKPDLALALLRDASGHAPENSVITANAELAAAAFGEGRTRQPAAAAQAPRETAEAANQHIVRVNAAEQRLRFTSPALVSSDLAPITSSGPQIVAQPPLPVETQPLPALPKQDDTTVLRKRFAVLPTVREAATAVRPTLALSASPPEAGAVAVDSDGSVEVANGTGRRHMAARVRTYLLGRGLTAERLSNADHFAHTRTTITYRRGHQGLAEALSASLPVAPLLRQVTEQAADVRLQLGGDLLEFDRGLLQAERNRSDADVF